MVGARKERKSRSLVVTGEGRGGDGFWYAGTGTGDDRVGGLSCAEAGQKTTAWEAGNHTGGGESGVGPMSIRKK